MRYDYISILRGTATPREVHSDLMYLPVIIICELLVAAMTYSER